MNYTQAAVFAITLSDNSTWLVYSDNEDSARRALVVRMATNRMVASPSSAVLHNDEQSLIDGAQVKLIAPDSITDQGRAVINFRGENYTLVKDTPKFHQGAI